MSFTSFRYAQAVIASLRVKYCGGNSSRDAEITADAATTEGLNPKKFMSADKKVTKDRVWADLKRQIIVKWLSKS